MCLIHTTCPGPYYALGAICTVHRAYGVFRVYEGMEGRKNKQKEKIQYKIKYKTSKIHFFKDQNSTISLPVKWEVCEKSTYLSLCLAKGTVGVYNIKFGLSVFLIFPCIPSISSDNRKYTVVPTILFESPKGPSDEKCLSPLIRACTCSVHLSLLSKKCGFVAPYALYVPCLVCTGSPHCCE
jgi:hypothetical protein